MPETDVVAQTAREFFSKENNMTEQQIFDRIVTITCGREDFCSYWKLEVEGWFRQRFSTLMGVLTIEDGESKIIDEKSDNLKCRRRISNY